MKNQSMLKGWIVLLAFISYLIIQLGMVNIAIPILKQYTTLSPPEGRFIYPSVEIHNYLDVIGETGRNIYQLVSLYDVAVVLLATIFYSLLLTFILQKTGKTNGFVYRLRFLPIFYGFFDQLENILNIILINSFPKELPVAATLTSLATTLKFTCTLLTFIALILVLIMLANKKRRAAG